MQAFKLVNGLPVYLVEQHNLPLLQFMLVSNAGSIYDPPGQLGLAEMTAEMMDEGAGGRNALELSEEIDYLGISLGAFRLERRPAQAYGHSSSAQTAGLCDLPDR